VNALAAIADWAGRSLGPELGAAALACLPDGPTPRSAAVGQMVALGCSAGRIASSPARQGGALSAVVDARIDNRQELTSRIAGTGPPDLVASDGALLLRLYERWGAGCLNRLVGDFAFVLWDGSRGQMLLARDPLGIRPLVYWYDRSMLVAASEPSQLLRHPRIARAANWTLVADYLRGDRSHPGDTLYDGVRSVRPGHYVTVDAHGLTERRYWAPETQEPVRFTNPSAYGERFREILERAVARRLRTDDGRAGVLLSGGLVVGRLYRARSRAAGYGGCALRDHLDQVPGSGVRRNTLHRGRETRPRTPFF
jgi:asparagine synthase (glutamine-hydrolysing)